MNFSRIDKLSKKKKQTLSTAMMLSLAVNKTFNDNLIHEV